MMHLKVGIIVIVVWAATRRVMSEQQQYFRVRPQDTEVVEGGRTDLQCHIGNRQGAVQWSKDGFVLGYDPKIPGYPRYSMVIDSMRGVYNLRLNGVQLDDEGEYQCQVGPANKTQPIRAAARVTVLVPPRELEIEGHLNGSRLEVREAQRVSLTCVSRHSKPAAKLKWYRNGQLLQGGSFHPKEDTVGTRVHSTFSTIVVYVIMDDHGATYTCEAIHRALVQPLTARLTIDVLYPPGIPEIEGYQEGDIVQVGDTLTLACLTRGGNPSAELVWYRDNVQVDASYSSTSGREVTNIHTFTVDETDNNAIYRCEAANSVTYHPRIANVRLSVQFAPSKILISGPTAGTVGATVTLSCWAGPSNPASLLSWVVDGEAVSTSASAVDTHRGGFLTTSNLTITLTRQDPDNKTFSCLADSEALKESIRETIFFSVVYPPSSPEIEGYMEGTPIRSGDFQRIKCVAAGGNPLATLRWFKKDREIRAITSIAGNRVISELVIRADASDNGEIYRCEATNSATTKPLIAKVQVTVHFPPSKVVMAATPNKPKAGDIVRMTCESASSNPESSINWWKDGEALSEGYSQESKEGNHGGRATLSKLDVTVTSRDDGALFTCQATNSVLQRSVHQSLTIRVLFKPEFQVTNLAQFEVVQNETLVANVTARGNPAPSYSWKKLGGKPLPSWNPEILAHMLPQDDVPKVTYQGPVLTIRGTQREHTGSYECLATNALGSTGVTIHVKVLYPAMVTTVSPAQIISESENAFFECTAIGNPMKKGVITWRRKGFDLARRGVIEVDSRRANLTIANVSRSDSGAFQCVANNGIGLEHWLEAKLIVKFKPSIDLPKQQQQVAADLGGTAQLLCPAIGAPMVRFRWFNNSDYPVPATPHSSGRFVNKTTQSAKDEVRWTSILTIRDVQSTDLGTYTCTGENEMGSDRMEVILRERGAPEPPENLAVRNVTPEGVLLGWRQGFDGGSQQFFRVRYSPRGSSTPAVTEDVSLPDATLYLVSGLEPGTEYEFALMAWNLFGESAFTENEVFAQTTVPHRLPSRAVETKAGDEVSLVTLLLMCGAGTLLILLNGAIVACYLHRRKKRTTQAYPCPEISKGPDTHFGSSVFSRDKYHEGINGEALRSPLNEGEDTFHEEILMKEIMKQDADPGKSSKIGPKVPPRMQSQRWTSSTEGSCPDILKNGHKYVKDGCDSTSSEVDVTDLRRSSMLNEGLPPEGALYLPPPPLAVEDPLLKPGCAAVALGVSAVDLTSGKTKNIVLHSQNQPSLITLEGHFL